MQNIHPKCVNVFQKLSDHVFKSSQRTNHVSFDNSFTSDIITFNQSKCLHAKMCDYTLKTRSAQTINTTLACCCSLIIHCAVIARLISTTSIIGGGFSEIWQATMQLRCV